MIVEKIMPNFYRIEVPLPRSPLRVLNAYLVKGQRRNLLIDTGLIWKNLKKPCLRVYKPWMLI